MNGKTHLKLPEMVTYKCQYLSVLRSWDVDVFSGFRRGSYKLWLLLAAPSKTNALSMSQFNQDLPSHAPNLSCSSTSVFCLLPGHQQESLSILSESTLSPFHPWLHSSQTIYSHMGWTIYTQLATHAMADILHPSCYGKLGLWGPFYTSFYDLFTGFQLCICVSVCVGVWMHEYRYPQTPQEPQVSDPLGQKLLEVLSYPTWVLGNEFRSSARAMCTLHPCYLSSSHLLKP